MGNHVYILILSFLSACRQIDPVDCGDICCTNCSGVYQITPVSGTSFHVFCDIDTTGGPWTVIQRRFDGSVNFYRGWDDYKLGFGNPSGEYWLGLDYIYSLLSLDQQLYIYLEGWDGTTGYAAYQTFVIENETQKYKLTLGGFDGNVVDQFDNHNQYYFSTFEVDNDISTRNCAEFGRGGWWYRNCYMCNLNGLYTTDTGLNVSRSMNWNYFYSDRRQPPLKKTTMMVRRKNIP
ncbi:microfibril-associated glycoprotein 4-like isoform X2 [Mizuhopecten yessoensis]|uniref:microfibril-associated glycoprotein 4-like isoform X2 n=1 Tax=Mizuhopecten yessoensis TaxID=6573 RepID=UPI000B4590B2|nr:microfibril-associated glycoprotein 4-like isoform X2 [Mizuhopecten yessoensis]